MRRKIALFIYAAAMVSPMGNFSLAEEKAIVVPKAGGDTVTLTCTQQSDTSRPYVCTQGANALRGLHWGTGLLYDSSRGGVGEVKIVSNGGNNTIRVTKENGAAVRAAFELHYFFPMKGASFAGNQEPNWAWGPFVSLNSKPLDNFTGPVFTSAGIGLMVGAKVGQDNQHSINLGVGWLVDTDVKRLAAGISDGQATTLAPGSESGLLTSRTAQGAMVMLSYNFTLN